MPLASDPADVSFRKAGAEDAEKLLSLIEEYYAFDGIRFDRVSVRRGVHALFANVSWGGAWLIQLGGRSVGYFLLTFGFDLEFGGRQATVTELYLEPTQRRSGLGTRALTHIEDLLRDEGIEAFELQVERDNVDARAFYEKFGMQAHDRIPMSKRISEKQR